MRKERVFNFLVLSIASMVIFSVLLILIYTDIINEYYGHILILAGINTIVALGLNIITGFTGQLALGQAGFMIVGAYTTSIFIMRANFPLFPAIIMGGVISAAFGILIGFPALRLRGDYLAITTLGFGEILRVIINNMGGLTGGAAGLKGIPGFNNEDWFLNHILSFVWVYWFLIGVLLITSNTIKSSHGRAIISIREDEIASGSMGVNTGYYKLFAFTLAAFIAGIGGGLYAIFQQYLVPTNAGFMNSVFFVVYVVFGGLGSITGTVLATVSLTYAQEILRVLGDYRLVIFGLLLIVMMIFWPGGIMGTREFSFVKFVRDIMNGKYSPARIKEKVAGYLKKERNSKAGRKSDSDQDSEVK